MDLLAVIANKEPAPAGVTVRRCSVVLPLVITLALAFVCWWCWDYAFSGEMRRLTGKGAIGLVAFPFIVGWWIWNSIRAFRFRNKGQFGWALSDTHFAYVPPGGGGLGQIALSAIASVEMVRVPDAGKIVEIGISGSMNGKPVTLKMPLVDLGEAKIGLLAMRPSNGKDLFEELQKKLAAANPKAKVDDFSAVG
jgi:hypothetical protein